MLLERDTELTLLGSALAAAVGGRGGVALLTGEAGAGKTSLTRALAEASRDVRVVRSFCEDLSVPDPLGPLYDIARDLELELGPESDLPQIALYSRLFDALRQVPTLVIVEDLHWADDATLDFVRFLGRRVEDAPVLLLLTARSEAAKGRQRLRRALAEVPGRIVTRIEVPSLTLAAVRTLAGGSAFDPDAIFRATAGNAFYVSELLRSAPSLGLPANLRETVLARADRLSDDARAALDLAAIFPRHVEAPVLTAMLGSTTGIDAAVAAGMLDHADGTYAFRHEVARRAVEMALSPSRRQALNAQALAALRPRRDVPVARLVHHAREAADHDVVMRLAPDAAVRASSLGAHHEAASHYRAALEVLPSSVRLLHALAVEYHLCGRLADAISCESRALELHRAMGDRPLEGDSLRWLSRFSYLAGRRDDADRFGQEAVQVLEPLGESPELAMAYANLSQLGMLAEHLPETLDWADRAMTLATRLGRDDIVCATLNNRGNVQRWRDPAAARRDLQLSLDMALQHNWQEHAARAFTNRACLEIEQRDFVEAHRVLSAGIAYCAERDLDTLRLYMTGWLARLVLLEGDWIAAAATARAVLDNELATPLARFQAGDVDARLRLRHGDNHAAASIDEMRALLEQGPEFQRLAPYATLMAERAWLSGEGVEDAKTLLADAIAIAPDQGAIHLLALWRDVLADTATDWSAVAEDYRDTPYEQAVALLHGDEAARRRGMMGLELLGASAALQRARELLREQGLRGPRASTLANSGLTLRELDVLKLLDGGHSNKAIAQSLGISPKTVDHHVSAVIGKLEADSRGHAVAVARQRGLI